MKSVASLLAGTALAVTILMGGVVVASAVLVPNEDVPRFTGLDVKDLWTETPVRVDPQTQTYERVPPRYGSQVVMADNTSKAKTSTEKSLSSAPQRIDLASAHTMADDDTADVEQTALPEAHISWCHARYRSYSPDDNSYISFQGDMRTCMSPYLDPSQVDDSERSVEEGQTILVEETSEEGSAVAINSAHAQNCLQRYRSYRAEDNSYQPYGGGPRKQCELRSF